MKRYILYCTLVAALAVATTARGAVTLNDVKPHVARGDYEAALAVLRTVMDKPAYAKHAEYNKYYGQCLCLTGHYAESVPYLEYGMKHGQSGSMYYLGIARQHLYDFDGAIEALEGYKKKLKLPPLWTARVDSIVAECRVGQKAVAHVEDVVIVDSIVLPSDKFYQAYRLGAESGRYVDGGADGRVWFENVTADYRLAATADGRLADAHRDDSGEWESARPIDALAAWPNVQFPWQRTGGEVVYFASDTTPGMGGLDIYKTTYNTESETYYTPERLGAPFNSPYDDLALAIDETHQVGWWATTRSAPAGHVTVYLFLLTDEPTYLEGQQASRARIDRLADTWADAGGYADLVAAVMQAPQEAVAVERVVIPIDDRHVYTSAADFRNPAAREAYDLAERVEADMTSAAAALDAARREYHSAGTARRQAMQADILRQEKHVAALAARLAALRKQYRSLEAAGL